MKTYLATLFLTFSTSVLAQDFYLCDFKMNGQVIDSLKSFGILYGRDYSVDLEDGSQLFFSFKSTGRSNKMPRNRLAFVLIKGETEISRAERIYDILEERISVENMKSEPAISVECAQTLF